MFRLCDPANYESLSSTVVTRKLNSKVKMIRTYLVVSPVGIIGTVVMPHVG